MDLVQYLLVKVFIEEMFALKSEPEKWNKIKAAREVKQNEIMGAIVKYLRRLDNKTMTSMLSIANSILV